MTDSSRSRKSRATQKVSKTAKSAPLATVEPIEAEASVPSRPTPAKSAPARAKETRSAKPAPIGTVAVKPAPIETGVAKSTPMPASSSAVHDQGARIFDELEFATYVEELLSLKMDEVSSGLDRTLEQRLSPIGDLNARFAELLARPSNGLTVEPSSNLRDREEAVHLLEQEWRLRTEALDEREAAILSRDEVVRTREESLRTREESLRARDETVGARDESLRVREAQLDARERSFQAREEAAADETAALRSQLKKKDDEVDAVQAELGQFQSAAARLEGEVAAVRSELMAARREAELRSEQLTDCREELTTLRDEIQRARQQITALNEEISTARRLSMAAQIDATKAQEALAKKQVELDAQGRELAILRAARSARPDPAADEIEQLKELAQALNEALTLAQTPAVISDGGSDAFNAHLRSELTARDGEVTRLRAELGQHERDSGESRKQCQQLTEQIESLRQQLIEQQEKLRKEVDASSEQLAALTAERDQLRTRLAQQPRAEAAEAANPDLEARLREAEQRTRDVEAQLRSEIEMMAAKKNALTETLRAYSDPDKLRDIKVLELTSQLDTLNATMREKDILLGESGKEQLIMGQEIEKVRKERYESQVMYERRIKELEESLNREKNDRERERQERLNLEEMMKSKKKWPLW